MLRDLTIQNYRTFKDFHIDGLARVNLLVGINNTGKTSLLEAVYLLVNQGKVECLLDLLERRGERGFYQPKLPHKRMSPVYQLSHICYGHKFNFNHIIHIKSTKDQPLSFKIQPIFRVVQLSLFREEEDDDDPYQFGLELEILYGTHDTEVKMSIDNNGLLRIPSLSERENISFSRLYSETDNNSIFLSNINFSFEQLALWWDVITLTSKEDMVLEALRILEPNVERISFTSRQTANSGILLKLKGKNNPIPLGSMGDGMRRILTLAIAAVTAENKFILVDEIETGLHYETQTEMWRFVMEVAKQLNIQVFATTHSWDCIVAFQEALEQTEDSSIGKLFRLDRQDDNIKAVEYTPDKLSVAVRQSIEVR